MICILYVYDNERFFHRFPSQRYCKIWEKKLKKKMDFSLFYITFLYSLIFQ